jgi:hypothetical protein
LDATGNAHTSLAIGSVNRGKKPLETVYNIQYPIINVECPSGAPAWCQQLFLNAFTCLTKQACNALPKC